MKDFRQKYFAINEQMGLKQYLIPYLMSSHPGSTLNSAIELAEYLRDIKYQPEQVQDLLSNTRNIIYNNVLYWIRSLNYERSICTKI